MSRAIFLFLTIFLISCFEQGDCSDVSSNVMQVNFYSNSSKQKLTINLDSIKIDGQDTVMHKDVSTNSVSLPLDPAVNSLTYIFYYDNVQSSVTVEYGFTTFTLAPDCNAIELIKLRKLSAYTTQGATILQPNLTSNTVENVKLFF